MAMIDMAMIPGYEIDTYVSINKLITELNSETLIIFL